MKLLSAAAEISALAIGCVVISAAVPVVLTVVWAVSAVQIAREAVTR